MLDAATGRIEPGFPKYLYDTSWSSPAVADLYGDGRKEIITGADLDGEYSCPGLAPDIPGCTYGGLVRVFDTSGRQRALFNVPGEVVWSSPAMADVNGDGHPDVVVGTGQNYASIGYPTAPSHRVWALDGRTLRPLPRLPVTLGGSTMSSPAMASVDGRTPWAFINSTDGRLTAIDGGGPRAVVDLRDVPPGHCGRSQAQGDGSPTVADINGDGRLEVLTVVDRALVVVDALSGTVLQDTALGSGTELRPFVLETSPTVVTIDGHAVGVPARDPGRWRPTACATPTTPTSSCASTRPPARRGAVADVPRSARRTWAPWARPGRLRPDHRHGSLHRPRVRRLHRCCACRRQHRVGLPAPARLRRRAAGRRMVAAGPVHSGHWLGGIVDDLYVRILGRAPSASARADRVSTLAKGGSVDTLAMSFYATDEYVARVGGTPHRVRGLALHEHPRRQPQPGTSAVLGGTGGQAGARVRDQGLLHLARRSPAPGRHAVHPPAAQGTDRVLA